MAYNYFAYTGVGDPLIATSYTRMFSPNVPSCTDGCFVCAIRIDDNSFITPDNVNEIIFILGNAIGTGTQQSDGDAKVLMKDC